MGLVQSVILIRSAILIAQIELDTLSFSDNYLQRPLKASGSIFPNIKALSALMHLIFRI